MLCGLRGVAAGFLIGALALPAAAQPAPAEPSAACLALLDGTPFTAVSAAVLPDGGCRFNQMRFGFGSRFAYEAASVVEHGLSSTGLALPDRLTHARVEWHDIVFTLNSGNPVMDWVNRQQQVPFDVVLDLNYDPTSGEAVLGELSLSGTSLGTTKLSGRVHLARDLPPANATLESLTLHTDSRRFIPAFLLSLLAPVLPPEDPTAAVATYKLQAETTLRAMLPQTGASPGTVDALARFIEDFPHPTKVLNLEIIANPPLGMVAAEAAGQDPASVLTSLSVTASYDGEAH